MNTATHTHTHRNTGKAIFTQTERRTWVTAPKLAPRCTLILPPPFFFLLSSWVGVGGGGGYTGVTCLLLKVSKHPGESLFTPLKKVGIPISRRPSSPSATHGCRGDEKRNQEAATAINRNFFFFGLPSCWCLRLFNTFTLLSLAYLRFSFCLFSSLLAHSGPTSTPNLHALIPFI